MKGIGFGGGLLFNGEQVCVWDSYVLEGSYGSGLWKRISKGNESLSKLVSFKVCKGERVRFWFDQWCTCIPLQRMFFVLFSFASNKEGSVKEYMIRSHRFCSWNLHFRRNINDWELRGSFKATEQVR